MRKLVLTTLIAGLVLAMVGPASAALELWVNYNGSVNRYNPDTGAQVGGTINLGAGGWNGMEMTPDGSKVAIVAGASPGALLQVDLYNLDGTKDADFVNYTIPGGVPEFSAYDLKFGPDGKLYVSALVWDAGYTAKHARIYAFDATTGAYDSTLLNIDNDILHGLSFAPDGLFPLFANRRLNSSQAWVAKIQSDGTYAISSGVALLSESMTLEAYDGELYIASHSQGNMGLWDPATNYVKGDLGGVWEAINDESEKYLVGIDWYGTDTMFVGNANPGPNTVRKYTGTGGMASYTLADATFIASGPGTIRDLVLAPEPATLGMLLIGGLALLRRRA